MNKVELSLTVAIIGIGALIVLLIIQAVHGFVQALTENHPQIELHDNTNCSRCVAKTFCQMGIIMLVIIFAVTIPFSYLIYKAHEEED